jgi:hypothetical protein
MKVQENLDEYYKQIFYSNDYLIDENNPAIRINLFHRSYLLIFIFLIFTSQSNALSIPQSTFYFYFKCLKNFFLVNYHHIRQPLLSFPINKLQLTDISTPSVYTYKIYRSHPEAFVQQQLKRERYRRTMIDRLFSKFDDDGLFSQKKRKLEK